MRSTGPSNAAQANNLTFAGQAAFDATESRLHTESVAPFPIIQSDRAMKDHMVAFDLQQPCLVIYAYQCMISYAPNQFTGNILQLPVGGLCSFPLLHMICRPRCRTLSSRDDNTERVTHFLYTIGRRLGDGNISVIVSLCR